jgi:hypothetical protein
MKTGFFIVSLICLLVSINVVAAEFVVEEGLAQFVADTKVHRYHKTKKLHSSDTYYDMSGDINAYVYTYLLPNNTSDKDSKPQQGVALKETSAVTPEIATVVTSASFIEKKQQLTTLRQQQTGGKEIAQARNELRQLEKQMRQHDRFVTIVISASLEKGPVLDRYFGLPHHIYKQELIKAKAGTQNFTIANQAKVVMVSPQELYFVSNSSITKNNQSKTTKNNIQSGIKGSSISVISINDGSVKTKAVPTQVQAQKSQMQTSTIDDSTILKEWQIYRRIYLNREVK